MIRVVREGYAPNCSSVGSVVGLALASATLGAAVVNAWADRFFHWPGGDAVRPEGDGALLKMTDPPGLLLLDGPDAVEALARGRVVGGDALVQGAFSAPTEVHLAMGSRCPVACRACYLDAGPSGVDADLPALLADLERLAASGVLEIALGGGESAYDERIVPIAEEIRRLGMIPNLTTSGFGVAANAEALVRLFGQINVSIDGLGEDYRGVRGWDGTELALTAIAALQQAGALSGLREPDEGAGRSRRNDWRESGGGPGRRARVGVNTVLTRSMRLEPLAERLLALGVRDWQWLRLKPAGRATRRYDEDRLTREQIRELYPMACAFEARGLRVRWDCALVPFLVDHELDPEQLARLGVWGCPGGVSLLARDPSGRWQGCSFDAESVAGTPVEAWRTLDSWRPMGRTGPCATCALAAACRGGCRVVSRHVLGDPSATDPECPRVTG